MLSRRGFFGVSRSAFGVLAMATEDVTSAISRGIRSERKRDRVGLILPSPWTQRSVNPVAVMGTPPTVTAGAASGNTSVSTSISGAQRITITTVDAAGNPLLRTFGGNVAVDPSTSPYNFFSPTTRADPWGFEFEIDIRSEGKAFEVILRGKDSKYRIWVNEQWVTTGAIAGPSSAGLWYDYRVEFASTGTYRIRVEGLIGQQMGGVWVDPLDTVWAPPTLAGPRWIVAGDSWTAGTGATGLGLESFATRLRDVTGVTDTWAVGVSGGGYLNPGSGSPGTLRSRLNAEVLAFDPDVVVCAIGTNDYLLYTPAAIEAECRLTYAQIQAHSPKPALIVVGPWYVSGFPSAPFVLARDAIRKAAADFADLYIDTIGGPYPYSGNTADYSNTGIITGTGKAGDPKGNGNGDVYMSADGSHPSTAGHAAIARWLGASILAHLQNNGGAL